MVTCEEQRTIIVVKSGTEKSRDETPLPPTMLLSLPNYTHYDVRVPAVRKLAIFLS